MVKKLKEKMHTLLEARKENKGFTLVELIVVIVILAILIGVTIGGVYGYVNKSRINTDINNASSISASLAAITTNQYVTGTTADWTDCTLTYTDGVATPNGASFGLSNNGTVPTDKDGADASVTKMFPQGIPEPKTAGAKYQYKMTVDTKTKAVTSIAVRVVDSTGTALVGEE